MEAISLRTEYLVNPVGIGIRNPRLMWLCDSGVTQTAYRITAETGGKTVWDSGRVGSSSMYADYPLALASRSRIIWRIQLWDENGETGGWSEQAFFETGLLEPSDWRAQWITGDYTPKKGERYPVDCFKKEFECANIVSARLYASACGLYRLKLNGRRVGDAVFAPGSTDYRKRIQYQTYDVTDLLKSGGNVLTAELADGWYRGSNGSKGRLDTYGRQTKLLVQLELTDANGAVSSLVSDGSWAWSSDGPIRFADLKDGETVDAAMAPGYGGSAKTVAFKARLCASDNAAVKEMERFSPAELIVTPKGKKVLKFPQNLSGYISFRVNAKAGQKIHIALGEMLDGDGELTLNNIQCVRKGKRSPLQEIAYSCADGVNEYTPGFFYGGFQYAQIDADMPFEKDDFTAVAVYSAFEQTCSFDCSHPLVNRLYANTLWSLKSNSTDFPSDCPTRERMGWTGDSQIFFNTASFMTDYAAFARKHVRDIYDRQWAGGRLPQIAPFANEDWFMWVMNGSVGWACAGVYIPLNFYRKYGDRRILEDNFEGMLKYARFMIRRAGRWGGPYAMPMWLSLRNRKYAVNCGQSYGEWTEPDDVCSFHWYDLATPHPEESTAYTYYTLKTVLDIAEILGKEGDERLPRIRKYSEGAKRAYQELVTTKRFSLDTDRQARLVRPIYMGLLDEEQTAYAKTRLIKALDNYGWRLGTGFLATPFILSVLQDIDVEYAYKLLLNERIPGWLAMPKNGATTIWEAWEGNATAKSGIASLNHYSKGAVCEWLISRMCGVRVDGENRFVIAPSPGGGLTHAETSYKSVYGAVSCRWEVKDGKTIYTITVPANTTAKIILHSQTKEVSCGTYEFVE